MTCEQMNDWLDRWMDDELSEAEQSALKAHCETCPRCEAQYEATLQLRALLGEMAPEADVPLATQAAWRTAVRKEADRRRVRSWTRFGGMAAAALVVALGVGLLSGSRQLAVKAPADSTQSALKAAPSMLEEAVLDDEAISLGAANFAETEYMAVEEATELEDAWEADVELEDALPMARVEADGQTDAGSGAMEAAALPTALPMPTAMPTSAGSPMHELDLKVEDVSQTCTAIEDLAAEYEASVDVQRLQDGTAKLYITLDSQSVGEFMEALAHWDASEAELAAPDVTDETVTSLLVILNP